jgi:hypothetical protein
MPRDLDEGGDAGRVVVGAGVDPPALVLAGERVLASGAAEVF